MLSQLTDTANNLTNMLLPAIFGGFAALTASVSAQSNSSQILTIDQTSFNVLKPAPPPSQSNLTTVNQETVACSKTLANTLLKIFVPPGITLDEALAKPFHVYDPAFLDIIGDAPTLTVIASQGVNPLFHEAVVW